MAAIHIEPATLSIKSVDVGDGKLSQMIEVAGRGRDVLIEFSLLCYHLHEQTGIPFGVLHGAIEASETVFKAGLAGDVTKIDLAAIDKARRHDTDDKLSDN